MSQTQNDGGPFCSALFECQFGLDQKHDAQQMEAMRYTTAMHMLRIVSDKQPYKILALCPNRTFGTDPREYWDVIDVTDNPYDGNKPERHGVIASDECPLNAVATAAKVLGEEDQQS